ncbi:MAG: YihY family inner membrane protein [Thiomonas sp.]
MSRPRTSETHASHRRAAPGWLVSRGEPTRGALLPALRTLARRFAQDNLAQTAGSLTLTTLISLVRLLTVVLAVFTAFPAFDRLQGQVQSHLAQSMLPEALSDKVYHYLSDFAARAKGLGVVSVLFLIVTATSMMLTVDRALNAIWRTPRPRPLAQRVLLYWAGFTLGPLVLGASIGLMSYVAGAHRGLLHHLPGVASVLLSLASWAVMAAALAAMFRFIPNTEVQWRDALIGGVVAAMAFSLGGRALAWYFSSVTTYTAVYGTFATLPLLLLWIDFSWIAVLVGAMIAAYLPSLRGRAIRHDGYAGAEFLGAVQVLKQLHHAQQAPDCGLSAAALSRRLQLDPLQLQDLLTVLERLGWVGKIAPGARGPSRWALLCNPKTATVGPLIDALLLDKRHAMRTSPLLGHLLSDDERDWSLDRLLTDPAVTAGSSASATTSPSPPSD